MMIDDLRPNFIFVELSCLDDDVRSRRWYRISWETTLLGPAVVRMYGRAGQSKRTLQPLVFESLDEAWPEIRSIIEQRLAKGYSVTKAEPPMPRVTMRFQPASMTEEEIMAYEQLDLVIGSDEFLSEVNDEEANGVAANDERAMDVHDSVDSNFNGVRIGQRVESTVRV